MSAATATTSRGSWSLVVNALAELGARELERRAQAAQEQAADDEPRRDDAQHDDTTTSRKDD